MVKDKDDEEMNNSSPKQRMFLKCKSFDMLTTVPSTSTQNISVESPRKRITRKSTNTRAQENVKKLATQIRKQSSKKEESDDDDFVETKKKAPTPRKRRKPLLTVKCNKITDYFGMTTKTEVQKVEVPARFGETSTSPSACVPADLIVLDSSDDDDKSKEQVVPVPVEIQPTNSHPVVSVPVEIPQTNSHNLRPKKSKGCPDYKIIEGTNFAVDAFRFGEIAGVTKYFLTHFHSDHYVGLTSKFNKPIYMSTITGRLVKATLKVNPKHIRTMNINTMYVIDGVEVTPIDANHCPGAVMFVFKLQCGRTILHTGDFRATPEMESNPVFWNNNFYSIYLDTTYLHKSYNFCTQSDALSRIEDEVKKFKEKNIGMKYLILVGSYVIGKERVWSHIAQTFNMKVWLEKERRKAFDLIYSDENQHHAIKDCICDSREEAQMHILPLQCINYRYLVEYSKQFEDYNLLGIRPTGWEKDSKPVYSSRISIVGVQYSEHSSYAELERFVRFVRPEKVISTVPKSSSNSNTQTVPKKWLTSTRPMTSSQRTVTSFMKVRKNTIAAVADKTVTSRADIPEKSFDGASFDSLDTDFMP